MGARIFLIRLGACVLAFGLGVLAAEALVRSGGVGPEPRPVYDGDVLQDSSDPELSYENRPGAVLVARYRDRSGRTVRTVEQRVNSLGWRGPEGPLRTPAPERLRIAVVGDSQVFGMGVAEDETYPRLLEQALRARDAEPTWPGELDVLNFGVFGYQAAEKARLIESRLPAYEPDLILMELYVWESARGQKRLARIQAGNVVTRVLRPRKDGWLAAVRRHSELVDFVVTGLFRRAWLSNWRRAHQGALAAEGHDWEGVGVQILRARAAAEEQGASFALVFFPMLYHSAGALVSEKLALALGAFASEHGIAFLDLHPTFVGRPLEPLRVHPDDYHFSAAGHRLAGVATAEFLAQQGLLRFARPPR